MILILLVIRCKGLIDLQLTIQGISWYWRSDTGWEKYPSSVTVEIEKAFQKKETKFSVDKQRYLSQASEFRLLRRYISFVDMLQLRFDDIFKTRSRGVQRRVNGKVVDLRATLKFQVWTGTPSWLPTRTDSGRIVPM